MLALRQVLWPSTPVPMSEDAAIMEVHVWADLFTDVPKTLVAAAMRSRRADAFAPTLGQVEEAISPTPTYAGALEEFRRMHARGYSTQRWSVVPWSHPMIAAFAEAHFAEWGQSPDGASDPALVQSEAAFRAHMRESFTAVQRRYVAGELGSPARTGIGEGRQIEEATGDQGMQVVRSAGAVGREREDRQEARAEPGPDHA